MVTRARGAGDGTTISTMNIFQQLLLGFIHSFFFFHWMIHFPWVWSVEMYAIPALFMLAKKFDIEKWKIHENNGKYSEIWNIVQDYTRGQFNGEHLDKSEFLGIFFISFYTVVLLDSTLNTNKLKCFLKEPK